MVTAEIDGNWAAVEWANAAMDFGQHNVCGTSTHHTLGEEFGVTEKRENPCPKQWCCNNFLWLPLSVRKLPGGVKPFRYRKATSSTE